MTLQESLEELRNNILRDRSDLIAGDADSFWSNDTLLRYIKDAEYRFARRVLLIHDGTTPEICQIRLRTGQVIYPLHKSIIGVLSAQFDTQTWDLRRSGHAIVSNILPPEFLTFDPNAGYNAAPGAPVAYYTDETLVYGRSGQVTCSVFPAPDADSDGKVIRLRVIRTPISDYTKQGLKCESEIPDDYALDVLEWAAYRALRGYDADAGAPVSAEAHRDAFEAAITQAIRETKRKVFAQMGFQFGLNGFSWER